LVVLEKIKRLRVGFSGDSQLSLKLLLLVLAIQDGVFSRPAGHPIGFLRLPQIVVHLVPLDDEKRGAYSEQRDRRARQIKLFCGVIGLVVGYGLIHRGTYEWKLTTHSTRGAFYAVLGYVVMVIGGLFLLLPGV
jgi:hypothetical protein